MTKTFRHKKYIAQYPLNQGMKINIKTEIISISRIPPVVNALANHDTCMFTLDGRLGREIGNTC